MGKENTYWRGFVTGLMIGAGTALILAQRKSAAPQIDETASASNETENSVFHAAPSTFSRATDDDNVEELFADAVESDAVESDAVESDAVESDAVEDVQPNAADALAATTKDAEEVAQEIKDEVASDVQPNADDAKNALT